MKLNDRVEIRLSASGASRGWYLDSQLHRPLNSLEEHLVDVMEKQRQTLAEVGVCPNCLETPRHHVYEPFSSCSCGTGEDYGNRPLQKIQLVD